MRSQIVLGGNFKVYEDGSISKMFLGVEGERCRTFPGQNGQYAVVAYTTQRGAQKHAYVHRLVAQAFVPNPDGKPQVNHKDGNKRNNAAENLEWVTAKENVTHAYQTGLANPMADAIECSFCGTPTKSDTGVCPQCRNGIAAAKAKEKAKQARVEKYSSISLEKLTPTQKKYVQMAAKGLTAAEIAAISKVSRQCVSSALASALENNESRIFLSGAQKSKLISLYNKVNKSQRAVEEAALSLEEAKRKNESAMADLAACENLYGCTINELLEEDP